MANRSKQTKNAKLYWIVTALMLITATPVGLVMIAAKLFETKKQGKPQIDYDIPLGARTTAGSGSSKADRKDPLAPLQKKARWRIRFGGLLTAIFVLALPASFATAAGFADVWLSLCCAGASAVYLLSGLNLRKALRRYRNYLSMIGLRRSIAVSTLASAANTAPARVRADLEAMLDTGVLSEGFLDHNSDRLILSSVGLSDPPPAKKPEEKKAADPAQRENALLDEIRAVNDLVKNEKLSAQIDQIGMLTAKILDYEKSHPQSAPQLHSFLSYYLPTTLKILRAYGQLEAQEVSGANINAAMKRIEDMMDKVVAGFEKQLDQLFLGETMDITSDVEVLERMLAKDGLSGNSGMTLEL